MTETVLITKRGDFYGKELRVAQKLPHDAVMCYVDLKITGTSTTVEGQMPFAKGEYIADMPTFDQTLPAPLTESQGWIADTVMRDRVRNGLYRSPIWDQVNGTKHELIRTAARKAAHEHEAKLNRLFKADLLMAYSLPHPAALIDAMYSLAYDQHHGNGYEDVISGFDDLVELLDGYDVAEKLMK